MLTLEQDAPNEPRHNVVVDNVLVNSRKWQIDGNVTKHGTVQNNEVIKTNEDLIEIVDGVVKSKSDKTKHLDGIKIGPNIKRKTL